MTAGENRTCGGNLIRKQNRTQGGKKGCNLKSDVGKSGVTLRYHKTAAYKFLTHPQNDELRDH